MSDIYTARMFIDMVTSIRGSMKPKTSALPYKTKDVHIPVRDGASISARVYTPRRPSTRGCPCMYVCHGGGYVLGHIEIGEWLCEAFTSLGGVAVNVVYRHAPEYPFPVPVNDCYDGLKWVSCSLSDCIALRIPVPVEANEV